MVGLNRWLGLAALAGAVSLSGCAGNEPTLGTGSGGSDGSLTAALDQGPTSGVITKVSAVKVTPALNNVVQFRGSSSNDFTYDHLQSVLYCRAWRHAQANGFAGGYPLRFHKLEGANAESALVAIASVRMYEGANTSGKSSVNESWCSKVPRAAK
ncbi:MAG: hypothetical protein AAGF81_08320 [Pseudomonadota bacterium]